MKCIEKPTYILVRKRSYLLNLQGRQEEIPTKTSFENFDKMSSTNVANVEKLWQNFVVCIFFSDNKHLFPIFFQDLIGQKIESQLVPDGEESKSNSAPSSSLLGDIFILLYI